MIHVLDHMTDKVLGDSTKYRNDNHYESISNEETFYFIEPDTSKIAPFLNKKNRVIIPVDDGFFGEFIIDEAIQVKNEIEVFSKASYIELKNDEPIAPITLNGQTVNTAMDYILARSDWKRGITDYSGTLKIEFDEYINPYAALKRIASLYNLELRFRIETKSGRVTGRYVDMIKRIGENRGKEIVSGKDLIGARRIEKTDQVVTALYVIGPQKEDGTYQIEIVKNEEARQAWGRNGKHLWDIYSPQISDAEITNERLIELGEEELQKRISAAVSYEIEGADIENVFGREHEKVRLGDSARVKATEYNPPIYLDSRIISREGPIRDKAQKRYVLGEFIEYSEEDITAVRRMLEKQIAKKVSEQQLVEYAEPVIPEQPIPPNPSEHPKWVDTSGEIPQMKLYDFGIEEWTTVKGEKGDPGPQGPPGTSVVSIVEYYLATDQSSGVTRSTPGWTTTIQQMTPQKRYLWNYEKIHFSDDTTQNTLPVIIGIYGDEGEEGRSIVDITEYYLATNASSGVTRSTSGWTTTMQVTTPEKKYLWNYEIITWNKAPLETYTEPVIIGVHGEQGPKGDIGQGVEDVTPQYYLSNSDSELIGGTWTETKPPYQKNKYLWTRNKITYKNPTEAEYTTPVLDDSWNAIAEAEEAKQEAQNAMSTADGKNTVFRQSSQPPTTGRKIGDLWFKTNEGNKMFVWTGSWTETKLDYQALAVGKLSAISADLGDVTAGKITGVEMYSSIIQSVLEDATKRLQADLYDGIYRQYYKDKTTNEEWAIEFIEGIMRARYNHNDEPVTNNPMIQLDPKTGTISAAKMDLFNWLIEHIGNGDIQFSHSGKLVLGQTVSEDPIVRKNSPRRIFEVPGRTNNTQIYWNATASDDYGLYFMVDGVYVGRMTSAKNWESEGNLNVKGEHISVNKVRFAQRSIGSAQNGDLWYGNAFDGLGWYGRKPEGWVKVINS